MTACVKRRWMIALGGAGLLTLVGWKLANPRNHDPYPFLAEHPIEHVAVKGPGSWGPSEIRTYTWKEPWRKVAERARKELHRFGLKEQSRSRDRDDESAEWMGEIIDGGLCGINSDTRIFITPGKCNPPRYSDPPTDGDPEWVTVAVTTFLEDNWVNIVRYTFFAMGE